MGKIIGIDLGTTNSCVAVVEGGEPVVITNAEGMRTTPSVVAFGKDGEKIVGEPAKRQAVTNPERTIMSIKREMGKDHKVHIDGKDLSPQEISAMILQKLKADAESYLGEPVNDAVITVPAYFTDAQRQATKDAGRIAGLNVVRIINEPTAAALAYGLDKAHEEQKILVFDLGGGTFDVSILEIGDGAIEVLATSGNNHLGGDDFDQRLVDYMADEFKKAEGVDLRADRMSLQRLREAAEKAKKELSSVMTTNVNLPFITATHTGPKHLNMDITRAKFNELTADLVEKTMEPTRNALKDAGLQPSDLDKVLLVGGSTRTPAVQEAIKKIIGIEPDKGINPDECVAVGAAIQGGILGGEVKHDLLLLDVTPLSLGIETLGGVMTKIIDRNTTIPTKKSQVFSTAADNQTAVDIHVLQGERSMASDNVTLGRFQLTDIPAAPRGVPQIEVTFDIDANGIVHVTAKDLGTGKQQAITITSSTNLTEEQIQQKVKEAEMNAAKDKERKEKIEAVNHAESTIYQTEKTLKEVEGKVSDADKKAVEEAIEALRKVKDNQDSSAEEIKKAMEELMNKMHPISQKLYEEASKHAGESQAGAAGGEHAGGKADDVVDADYEVVDDDK